MDTEETEKKKKDSMERIADALERIADVMENAFNPNSGRIDVNVSGSVETYQG